MKKVHYISGIIITIFVGLHLFNHIWSIFGIDKHIEIMNILRPIYRNVVAETILLIAVGIQIISGFKLFRGTKNVVTTNFDMIHIWTGLYLAIFFVIHISAVFIGRYLLDLDTNFYFAAAGLNYFPLNLFFLPYYSLAIISFFGHIASIHKKRMKHNILGLKPDKQSITILAIGMIIAILILYGFTNHFYGITIPEEYKVLIGK